MFGPRQCTLIVFYIVRRCRFVLIKVLVKKVHHSVEELKFVSFSSKKVKMVSFRRNVGILHLSHLLKEFDDPSFFFKINMCIS